VYFNVNLKLLTKLINSAFVVCKLRRIQNARCIDKNLFTASSLGCFEWRIVLGRKKKDIEKKLRVRSFIMTVVHNDCCS